MRFILETIIFRRYVSFSTGENIVSSLDPSVTHQRTTPDFRKEKHNKSHEYSHYTNYTQQISRLRKKNVLTSTNLNTPILGRQETTSLVLVPWTPT